MQETISSTQSIKALLQETMYENFQSIQKELESFLQTQHPTHLHEYRVKIRTVRSVCKTFSRFIKPKRQKYMAHVLKKLQRQTNTLRDMDVFLENIETYKKIVINEGHYFSALYHQLEQKRITAWKYFSEKHALSHLNQVHLMNEWIQKYPEKMCTKSSNENLQKHALTIIQKEVKKILSASATLSLESENEAFHTLRLHYKKLRYTTDALGLKQISKQLKIMQTAFGEVQDKNVQIAHLYQNASSNIACQTIVSFLTTHLQHDKAKCIELSRAENLQILFQPLLPSQTLLA